MVNARAIVNDWLGSVEAMNFDQMLAGLADDFQLAVGGLDRPIGKRALSSYLERLGNPYESIELERQKIIASGKDVAVLMRIRATMRDDISMLGEELATAGKKLDVMGALFLTVDDAGKITRMSRVRDSLEVVRQLELPAEQMISLLERVERYFEGME